MNPVKVKCSQPGAVLSGLDFQNASPFPASGSILCVHRTNQQEALRGLLVYSFGKQHCVFRRPLGLLFFSVKSAADLVLVLQEVCRPPKLACLHVINSADGLQVKKQ